MYCGDETGAFIGDFGGTSLRFGYGGEDLPKYVIPPYISGESKKIPSSPLHAPASDSDVVPIYKSTASLNYNAPSLVDPRAFVSADDGHIENWDAYEAAWESSFEVLRVRDSYKHSSRRQGQGQGQDNNGKDSALRDGKLAHPLLAIHPGFTQALDSSCGSLMQQAVARKQKERMLEVLMEGLDAPAVFLAPAPMLQAFCAGRQTALVVDVGGFGSRVTPVVDGLILQQSQRRSGRGGEWLNALQSHALTTHLHTTPTPRYQSSSLKLQPPNTKNSSLPGRPIFHNWATRDLLYEMKTAGHVHLQAYLTVETCSIPFLYPPPPPNTTSTLTAPTANTDTANQTEDPKSSTQDSSAMDVDMKEQEGAITGETKDSKLEQQIDVTDGSKVYVLPDGTRIDITQTQAGRDLCRLPELLFAEELPFMDGVLSLPSQVNIPENARTLESASMPLQKLIHASLSAVGDVDVRKELCGNIILTGGSSLFANMDQRLSHEVSNIVPNIFKCKVLASRNTMERRFAAWIGGSVLTSLGSFQQLWLSRTEYDEYGVSLATQRFP